MDVFVGDPNNPTRQALILDTGSTVTCIPCTGACKKCGKHIFPEFQYLKSSGLKTLSCKEHDCLWGPNDECLFRQAYGEGSAYEGFFVNDYFQFNRNTDASKAPKYTFGCVTKETNLFLSQEANGILGLGPADRDDFKPVFYTYYKNGFIDNLQFSLLLGKNGGKIFFGGYNPDVLANPEEPIDYYVNIEKDHYMVELDDYAVGDQPMPGKPMKAKIDSGVSMVYMTKKQYNMIDQAMVSQWKSGSYRWLGKWYTPGWYKFSPNNEIGYKEFFLSFPVISFHVGHKRLKWFPNDYFYRKNPTTFWLAIDPYSNDDTKILIGASFLRHNLVIFDVENSQIGIARAFSEECTENGDGISTWEFDPNIIKNEQEIFDFNKVSSTENKVNRNIKQQSKGSSNLRSYGTK